MTMVAQNMVTADRGAAIKHLDMLALEVAKQLHGLDMVDVQQVLDKVRMLIFVSSTFDATGPAFRFQAEGFTRHYGDPIDTPTRQ